MLLPEVEVVGRSDSARSALRGADRPVLRKGAGAGNRGLVDTLVGADSVAAAVRLDSTELSRAGARVVATVAFDNVVLGLGRVDPAVDGEVGAAGTRRVGARIGNVPAEVSGGLSTPSCIFRSDGLTCSCLRSNPGLQQSLSSHPTCRSRCQLPRCICRQRRCRCNFDCS